LAKLGGFGYDMLIVMNRFINYVLQMMGKEKMSFSKKVKNSVKKAVAWINNFEQTTAELAIEKKYDYVICGHIHQPEQKLITTKNGSVMYLNSGDWVENLTSLEYSNQHWELYQYNEATIMAQPQITMSKKLPQLNVLTDEINLFVRSMKTNFGNNNQVANF
jgi:UDP-2,3-diacylglucosamine pyrophosphatase LpxH